MWTSNLLHFQQCGEAGRGGWISAPVRCRDKVLDLQGLGCRSLGPRYLFWNFFNFFVLLPHGRNTSTKRFSNNGPFMLYHSVISESLHPQRELGYWHQYHTISSELRSSGSILAGLGQTRGVALTPEELLGLDPIRSLTQVVSRRAQAPSRGNRRVKSCDCTQNEQMLRGMKGKDNSSPRKQRSQRKLQ